jgi:hypothetical protein
MIAIFLTWPRDTGWLSNQENRTWGQHRFIFYITLCNQCCQHPEVWKWTHKFLWRLCLNDVHNRKLRVCTEFLQFYVREKFTSLLIIEFVKVRNKALNNLILLTQTHTFLWVKLRIIMPQIKKIESSASICLPVPQRILTPKEHNISTWLIIFKGNQWNCRKFLTL